MLYAIMIKSMKIKNKNKLSTQDMHASTNAQHIKKKTTVN